MRRQTSYPQMAEISTMSTTSPLISIMSTLLCFLLISSTSTILTTAAATATGVPKKPNTTPYLSPSAFLQDYQTMLSTFKLHPYELKMTPPLNTTATPSSPIDLFHSTLIKYSTTADNHTFLTQNPTAAHLFYIPFPPNLSSRSLIREISSLRSSHSYWDRSLAADHVFLSSCSDGTPSSSARNVVELRKNAVQITCVASRPGNFVPHKDIALPPLPLITPTQSTAAEMNHEANKPPQTTQRLGYYFNDQVNTDLLKELHRDPDFLIETDHRRHNHNTSSNEEAVDYSHPIQMMKTSRFCLFIHAAGQGQQLRGLAEAMARGCVPVVISQEDRPVHDMPLMDVLRWGDMAVFVGESLGSDRLKRVLMEVVGSDGGKRYDVMRELGMAAAKHLVWSDPPRQYDAFHMVVYQLWRRRHAVRFGVSEEMK